MVISPWSYSAGKITRDESAEEATQERIRRISRQRSGFSLPELLGDRFWVFERRSCR
jgi:hypothetical protein